MTKPGISRQAMFEPPNRPTASTNPFLAEFIATALAQFMALSRVGGRRWTKSAVAASITDAEDIEGSVSDTTIGRLLDPSYGQDPSEETLAAVGAFLVKMRAITRKQIELAARSPDLVDAATFPAIFRQPRSEAHGAFQSEFAARYGAVEVRGRHLLSSELVVKRLAEAEGLIASEVLSLFHVDNIDLLKRETRNLAPELILDFRQKLAAAGGRELCSLTSSGFAAASADLIAVFLRSDPRGFPSVLNVREVAFSAEDRILGLSLSRNSGWNALSADGQRPRLDEATMPPRNRARAMAEEMSYVRFLLDKTRSIAHDKKIKTKKTGRTEKDYFHIGSGPSIERQTIVSNIQDVNERLLNAIEAYDIGSFRSALSEGADPNIALHGSDEPIVFTLAHHGQVEWVEALIATRRCDLTRTDASGHRASHSPGVTARMFATSGSDAVAEKFTALALTLRDEELRQLARKRLARHPAP